MTTLDALHTELEGLTVKHAVELSLDGVYGRGQSGLDEVMQVLARNGSGS